MTIPRIVTNSALQSLAAPGETHEVHVILRRIANAAPYTLRGRRRQYIVNRDLKRGAHILKVPLSVWMDGCNGEKPVSENESIAYDIQGSRTGLKAPLTFEVWPIEGATSAATPAVLNSPSILPIFRKVLTNMHAPDIVLEALDLFETGNADGLQSLADSLADPMTEARRDGGNAYLAGKTPAANPFTADEELVFHAAWIGGFESAESMHQAPKPQAPSTEPAPLSNKERQAAYRARKKAEKEAAEKAKEAAKLQTA